MSFWGPVLVMLGGFAGGTARFFVSGVVARSVGETFPWGTIVVNVTGSFLIGLLAGYGKAVGGVFAAAWFHSLLLTGFCGGYTTVSSFSLQTLNLGFDGENRLAALNVLASMALCIAAVALGFWASSSIPM
jgi:CrcB protein